MGGVGNNNIFGANSCQHEQNNRDNVIHTTHTERICH